MINFAGCTFFAHNCASTGAYTAIAHKSTNKKRQRTEVPERQLWVASEALSEYGCH